MRNVKRKLHEESFRTLTGKNVGIRLAQLVSDMYVDALLTEKVEHSDEGRD